MRVGISGAVTNHGRRSAAGSSGELQDRGLAPEAKRNPASGAVSPSAARRDRGVAAGVPSGLEDARKGDGVPGQGALGLGLRAPAVLRTRGLEDGCLRFAFDNAVGSFSGKPCPRPGS